MSNNLQGGEMLFEIEEPRQFQTTFPHFGCYSATNINMCVLYEILNVLLIINLTELFSETLVITQIFSIFEQIHGSSVI